jgi:hypothetical protein
MTADPLLMGYRRLGLWAACRACLFLWIGAWSPVAVAQIAPAEIDGGQSRFQRTVGYLQSASPQFRAEFASIALTHIAKAYAAEAQLARVESRVAGGDAGLRGWSVAVDRYARQMPLLLEDVELGLPVRLMMGGEKSLVISVADRAVILSHPRLNQQRVFEQQVLEDFCARHSCALFIPEDSGSQPIPVSTRHVKPDWNFSHQEWFCSYQGIKVRFKAEQNLVNSRTICEHFMQEVVALADEIAWQQRRAVPIEWEELAIQPTPHRPEHMVQLNRLGDSVLVPLPLLYRSPGLLEKITPWIQQRLTRQGEVSVELDADNYDWQKF